MIGKSGGSGVPSRRGAIYLMDEREVQAQSIGNGRGSLCTSSVGTNNNCFPPLGDGLLDVSLQCGLAIQVVERTVEEALILRIVKFHGDDCSLVSHNGPKMRERKERAHG